MVRKLIHDDKEQQMIYEDLPNLFLEDVSGKFDKHFVKQWCGIDLIQLTIASIPKVSTYFAKWLLNIPIPNESVYCELNKTTIHLPLCIDFITRSVSVEDVK